MQGFWGIFKIGLKWYEIIIHSPVDFDNILKYFIYFQDPSGVRLYMTSFALSTFPVLYFFTFLYYTDPGSTFFVLFMYLLNLHDNHFMASIMAVVAIFFRQTNIVWVMFVAGLTVRKTLILWLTESEKSSEKLDQALTEFEQLKVTVDILFTCLKTNRSELLKLLVNILKEAWSYILVGIGFAVFVFVNEGIVVGARGQHIACLNFPQIFYFLCMTNIFAFSHLISPWKVFDFLSFSVRRYLFVGIFIGISVILIHNFTYQHEYLLADNRHYVFYVWSKIYRRHEHMKFFLIPVYLYCSWSVTSELRYCDIFWKIVFFLCLLMATVPQKLLEFRYFILPYLIFRMNCKYGTVLGLLHEILLYAGVNIATVYLFTEKPFRWANTDDLQRFMWWCASTIF